MNLEFWKLLFRIASRQTGEISSVTYTPQKPAFKDVPIRQAFPRATPESQGIPSEFVADFLREMREDAEANPHHVMILRHGNVIAECVFAPYVRGMWHTAHSLCKSFTGMAAGILIGEGKLGPDERVSDIFPEYEGPFRRIFSKKVTVEHLLNMMSGMKFAESGAVSGNEWLKSCLTSRTKSDPGTVFDYNSMNSYVLSAIVQKRTGRTLSDYLKEKLFSPMGIDEFFWEKSPEGITKGGWGMYIRPEDALKLGQLYLNSGVWNGRQLVPKEWVRKSTALQSDNGSNGYGYQIWLGEREGSFAYEGLFGQYVAVYPDLDMVVLVFAGNKEMMGSGNLTHIIRRCFGKNFPGTQDTLPENPDSYRHLTELIGNYETFPKSGRRNEVLGISLPMTGEQDAGILEYALMDALPGRFWKMEEGNIGVFPIVSQVLHNNYTDGIREVGFEKEENNLVLILREGADTHSVRVGFGRPEKSQIRLHGEPWLVGTIGYISRDETGRAALITDITFLEDTCTRVFTFLFDGEELELRAMEIPGDEVIRDAIAYTGGEPGSVRCGPLKKILENGGRGIIASAVDGAGRPTDRGHLKQ